jgi:hypothetical protein
VPEAQFGFFISYNSAAPKPGGGRGEVQRALFERYFPAATTDPTIVEDASARADARAVAGTYESSRRSETTFLKLAAMLGQPKVTPSADGTTITIDTSKNLRGQLKRWREIGPLVYHEINGPDKIAFRRDQSGRVTELLPQPPIFEAQRAVWYESKSFLLPVIGGSIAIILLTLVLWPVGAIVRRRYGRVLFTDRAAAAMFLLSRIVCICAAAWLAVLVSITNRAGFDTSMLGDRMVPWLHTLHVLGWLTAAGAIVVLIAAVQFWRTAGAGIWLRAQSTVLAVAMLAFVWFAWHCHLLDASLRF